MPFTLAISLNRTPFKKNPWLWIFLSSFSAIWISTLVGTNDLNNWLLENTLTVIFFLFLLFSYKKYQFSDLSYLLITVYLCLHVYGAKYTYAENPFGYWLSGLGLGVCILKPRTVGRLGCWQRRLGLLRVWGGRV